MEFKDNLRKLKQFFNVDTNKELANKLELSVSALEGWQKRKVIPKKYLKYIDNNTSNNFIGGNNIQISGKNKGEININSSNEMNIEICELIKKLDDKQREYYYHMIKADILKKDL